MRLGGLTVLDLTRLLPGPYATQILADLGADVVKVERPGTGDYARAMRAGDGPDVFGAVNRGKRSITLDFDEEGAREAFHDLASDADVVIESFRPGVAERLGIGYEAVSETNPDIVYCSLSGFGATGPNRERVGHDLNYVAMAGLLDMTRSEPGGRPAIPGFPIADMAGGLFAALSILGALLSRELGGSGSGDTAESAGEYIDLALTDAVVALSGAVSSEGLAGGDPGARETLLTGKYPCYDVYETADGEWVTLAALEPRFWTAFCEAIDRPDLADRHLASDPAEREAVREAVAEIFGEYTREEWERRLGDADVMFAPVRSVAETLGSEQVAARNLLETGPSGDRVGFPARIEDEGVEGTEDRVPGLGAHTVEVLTEAGYTDEEIRRLREEDAI